MADYLPTASDDAARQQMVSAFFWTAKNILEGTDTVLRLDPNEQRPDGMLGPNGSASSYGVGPNGEIYVRGTTGQTAAQPQSAQIPTVGGMTLTPGLLMLAIAAWFVFKH